jgi:DNA polymerase
MAASASNRAARLATLREEALGCRACPLWKGTTQTVFGEGPADARIMLVGEQPGDREDVAGHPFVGPAGRILDTALQDAAIDRSSVFLTNGVKHFNYRMRGKRRIHQRPAAGEIGACRQWLDAEIDLVSPGVIVAMGATATHSLFGRATPIGANRGGVLSSPLFAPPIVVTAHPASIVRVREREPREAALAALAEDLRLAASVA